MYRKLKERVYEANMELFHRKLIVYTWGNVSGSIAKRASWPSSPAAYPMRNSSRR